MNNSDVNGFDMTGCLLTKRIADSHYIQQSSIIDRQ